MKVVYGIELVAGNFDPVKDDKSKPERVMSFPSENMKKCGEGF